MPEYEIMRWDAVIPKGNTLPYPMIYIKPDSDFFDYAKENDFMFLLDIEGTGSDYDKMPIVGVTESSAYFPNFRPNFYNSTGYYVIVIFSNWIGYPEKNGKVKLRGVKGEDKIEIKEPEFKVPQPIEFYKDDDSQKNKRLNFTQISLVFIAILILFSLLFYISIKK